MSRRPPPPDAPEAARHGAAPAAAPALRTAFKVLGVALVLAAIVLGAWLGARQVYFLGTDEGGRLTLYRGLPYDLPFGVELYSEVYSIPVQVSSLPEDRRDERDQPRAARPRRRRLTARSLEADAAVPTTTPEAPPQSGQSAADSPQQPVTGAEPPAVGSGDEPRDGGDGAGRRLRARKPGSDPQVSPRETESCSRSSRSRC